MREVEALAELVARAVSTGQSSVTVDVETLTTVLALVPRLHSDATAQTRAAPAAHDGGLAAVIDGLYGNAVPAPGGSAGTDFLAGLDV